MSYPKAIQALIKEFSRLPGVGGKGAERFALHLARADAAQARALAQALMRLKEEVASCGVCRNLSDKDPCAICGDPRRDAAALCVVESPADLAAMEAAGSFQGLYYVLAGPMAPMRGIGPDQLKLGGLLRRIKNSPVKEVIIATNPTTEGEATASLLSRELAACNVGVSRLGYGMPVGGDLKYMDGLTLKRSLESRRKLD